MMMMTVMMYSEYFDKMFLEKSTIKLQIHIMISIGNHLELLMQSHMKEDSKEDPLQT